jgi:type I restriction enzyme S subunit
MKLVTLDSVLTFHRGITFKPDDKVEVGSNDSVVCLRTKNIQKELDERDLLAVPSTFVKRDELYVIQGDTLISTANSWNLVGKSVRIIKTEHKSTIGGFISLLRPKADQIDPDYLFRFITMDETQSRIRNLGKQTTNISNLDRVRFLKLKIPLPPLATQKKIAAVLEKADQLRKDSQQMEKELNSLAQSVFIDMFGDPVTNPKGWDKRALSEMLSVNHGYAFKSEYFTSVGDYVLLTPGNFKEEGGYWDRGDKQKYYSGEVPTGYILEKNDLLLAMTEQAAGLLGSSILVPESNKYLHNQRLGLVKFKDDEQNTVFYSYLFNNKSVRLTIHSSSTGTKVKHTSPTKLESIEAGVPPSAKQNEFEIIIKTIEQNIALNNKAKCDYEQSFNSLMQKAFKGELKL